MKKKMKAVKKAAPKKPAKKTAAAKKISKPTPKKVVKPVKKAAAKKVVAKKQAVKKAVKPVAVKKAVVAKKPVVVVAKVISLKGEILNAAELKEIKQHLIEMRDDAIARLKDKKDDMPEAEVGDPIDTASQSLDKEILFELSDNSQMLIDQIEAALRKIDKGIYGACESCRTVLPKKRIKALPFARYCINCQSSNESRRY